MRKEEMGMDILLTVNNHPRFDGLHGPLRQSRYGKTKDKPSKIGIHADSSQIKLGQERPLSLTHENKVKPKRVIFPQSSDSPTTDTEQTQSFLHINARDFVGYSRNSMTEIPQAISDTRRQENQKNPDPLESYTLLDSGDIIDEMNGTQTSHERETQIEEQLIQIRRKILGITKENFNGDIIILDERPAYIFPDGTRVNPLYIKEILREMRPPKKPSNQDTDNSDYLSGNERTIEAKNIGKIMHRVCETVIYPKGTITEYALRKPKIIEEREELEDSDDTIIADGINFSKRLVFELKHKDTLSRIRGFGQLVLAMRRLEKMTPEGGLKWKGILLTYKRPIGWDSI